MTDFAIALAALNEMKAAGILMDYAVSGAMALVFWTEPVATYWTSWCGCRPRKARSSASAVSTAGWRHGGGMPTQNTS